MCSGENKTLQKGKSRTIQVLAQENVQEHQNIAAQPVRHMGDQSAKKQSFLSRINPFVGKETAPETVEENKAKTIRHYQAVKKENLHKNISDETWSVQKEALKENCEKERNLPNATKEFKKVIESVLKYLNSDSYDSQQDALAEARSTIRKYLDSHNEAESDAEYELFTRVQAYDTYLDMNTNGSLDGYVHKEGEHENNPKIRTLAGWTSVKKQSLFPHEPGIHDIQQRTVQDCYMMAPLSAIAHYDPNFIKQAVKDNGDGTVTVRFYDKKTPEVFYDTSSVEQLLEGYEEKSEEEKQKVDSRLLEKMFFDFAADADMDDIIEELSEKEKKESSKNGETENLDSTDDLMDEFEEIEEFEPVSSSKNEDALKNSYRIKVEGLKKQLISNNEQWLKGLVDKVLSKEEKKAMLDELHKAGREGYQKKARELMKACVCKDIEKLSDETRAYNRSAKADQIVNSPVYVTVSKEIARFGKAVDTYAADSLWVQMVEKAYAVYFGKEKGYEGISLGKSYEFLSRFLNQDYRPDDHQKYILPSADNAFPVGERTIDRKMVEEKKKLAQKRKKNVAVSAEDLLEQFKLDSNYKDFFSDKGNAQNLVNGLIENFGMVHDAFSRQYTDQAQRVYDDYKNRLGNKEYIVVGCEFQTKEQIDYLTSLGIRNGHAYAVIDCFEQDGHRFVTLRDPYALFKREYTQVTDEAGNTHYKIENASQLGLSKNDSNGLFNMEFNDYLMTFTTYSAIKR